MADNFDLQSLCAFYDRGYLVPFIGSGMSRPACSDWSTFVTLLERQKRTTGPAAGASTLIQRALFALQALRQDGVNVADAISRAIYCDDAKVPDQAVALASIYWPLICTTNYDDIHLRAKLQFLQEQGSELKLPRVLGRTETDCRELLRHIDFPAGEAIWALQGLLGPRDAGVKQILGDKFDNAQFVQELVVGHAEYRTVANRAPHFRRCFAELFRTRSFLFLGSGLAEPYFVSLFDEIIELTGPPVRPHFALIPEGDTDPEFMRQRYHIICNTYPKDAHQSVAQLLKAFSRHLHGERARPALWGFRAQTQTTFSGHDLTDNFRVVRATMPSPSSLAEGEAIAISCGRGENPTASNEMDRGRGVPLCSAAGQGILERKQPTHNWESDWVVRWTDPKRSYGVVARELIGGSRLLEDQRSPEVIRTSFKDFLSIAQSAKFRRGHLQLLAAGPDRSFEPWVSLVQMARAYGEWFRENGIRATDAIIATVYVVDRGVIALMEGGYVDLARELQGTPIHVNIEVIDSTRRGDRYHMLVDTDKTIGSLVRALRSQRKPFVYAFPTPTKQFSPKPLDEVLNQSVREFGLVSGSTLVIDFREGIKPA
jgi:hypothetical protein